MMMMMMMMFVLCFYVSIDALVNTFRLIQLVFLHRDPTVLDRCHVGVLVFLFAYHNHLSKDVHFEMIDLISSVAMYR